MKKKFFANAVLSIAMSASMLGFVACGQQTAEKKDYGEAGVYYAEVDGVQYVLSLNDNKYTLTLGDASGDYTYDGTDVKMTGDGISAKIENGAVKVTYNGEEYTFMRMTNYTVSYDAAGGSAVKSETVVNGKLATKPDDPKKAGYDFVGCVE